MYHSIVKLTFYKGVSLILFGQVENSRALELSPDGGSRREILRLQMAYQYPNNTQSRKRLPRGVTVPNGTAKVVHLQAVVLEVSWSQESSCVLWLSKVHGKGVKKRLPA